MAASRPAIELLLERHRHRLHALAAGVLRDPDAADDVLQEAWVVAATRPPAYGDNLPGWLRTVVRRLALRRLRGESRRRTRERASARREGLPPASEQAAWLELERRLIDAVEGLEEPYRRTVVWRYLDGRMPREIARREGVPVATVKTRLARGLARLRQRLDARHDGRRAWAVPLAAAFRTDATAPTSVIPVLGGALMAKKLGIVAATVLLVALALRLWPDARPAGPAAPPEPGASPLEATLAGAPSADVPPRDGDAPPRGRLAPDEEIPATTFAGRVVDAQGAGVAGARVEAFYAGARVGAGEPVNGLHLLVRRERERVEAPAAATDAQGFFRIDRPWRARALLQATKAGFVPALTLDHASGAFVEITLRTEGELAVRVVDEDGARVRDAEVRLLPSIPGGVRRVLARARTDASGRAVLPRAREAVVRPAPGARPAQDIDRAGWYRLTLEVDPADPALGFATRSVAVGATEVEMTIPRVETVERRLVDAQTGRPVAGAYVDVLRSYDNMHYVNQAWRRRVHADARGVVRVPLQAGYRTAYASAPGYMTVRAWGEPVRLPRAMRVHGRVEDAAGAPVAGVPVYVVMAGGVFDRAYAGLPLVSAWSDAEGRFALETKLPGPLTGEGVPDFGIRTLIAAHPDHAPAVVDGVTLDPGAEREVVLRFPPAATIELKIVDTDDQPVADQWVGIARLVPRATSWPEETSYGLDVPGLVRHRRLRTDEAGRLTIDGLPPGTHRVRADTLERLVTLAAGETRTVRLVQGAGASIVCRVLHADGRPAAGLRVGLGGPEASAKTTDAAGRVRFEDLTPGTYSVSTSDPALRLLVRAPAAPDGEEVVLRLPAGPAKLEIQVEGLPDGVQPAYSLMTRTGGYVPRGTGFTPMEGHLHVTPGFTPGAGVLVVRAEGYGLVVVAFDAPALQTTPVLVALAPAARVTGTVEGDLPDGFLVFLKRQDPPVVPEGLDYAIRRSVGSLDGHARVASDGTFRVDDLPPGRYVAEYARWTRETKWDVRARAAAFTVGPGETRRVVLRPD